MTQLDEQWNMGYRDGWDEQGALPTSEPSVPPMPPIPPDVTDAEKWAYGAGRSRGMLDRVKKQAGLS
jgi:hypothetical protein